MSKFKIGDLIAYKNSSAYYSKDGTKYRGKIIDITPTHYIFDKKGAGGYYGSRLDYIEDNCDYIPKQLANKIKYEELFI